MSKRMIACDEAAFLISCKQENRLGFRRWWQLKMHLLTCHLCRKYEKQIAQLNRLVGRYREEVNSEACQHHLTEEARFKIHHVIERKR
ncbi:MAG: hypothetical protein ABFS10_15640 [Bacteroidota bacterium]